MSFYPYAHPLATSVAAPISYAPQVAYAPHVSYAPPVSYAPTYARPV